MCKHCLENNLYQWIADEETVKAYVLKCQPGEASVSVTNAEKSEIVGTKYDNDKLRWSLLPLGALQDVVKVLEFGAKKYAPDNWKYVDQAEERYWNAAMRHIVAYKLESTTDSETGLSHLAHAVCCLLFLQHIDKENN